MQKPNQTRVLSVQAVSLPKYFPQDWFYLQTCSFSCPLMCFHYFALQHRPPMKKVRKSLALDVIDCKEPRPARRQHSKPPAKPSRKVKTMTGHFNLISQWDDSVKTDLFLVSQADRSLSSSSFNSSFTGKKEENVLDQGFILGPNESGPTVKRAQSNPKPVPPAPVSHLGTLNLNWKLSCGGKLSYSDNLLEWARSTPVNTFWPIRNNNSAGQDSSYYSMF